jgi:hypothetical protein
VSYVGIVIVEQAITHVNRSMGKKITIDSATLMKGTGGALFCCVTMLLVLLLCHMLHRDS